MTKVGVLLSGCGVQDGSEVYEAVLTILALEKAGAQVVAIAPDVEQAEVINHYTGEETRGETRSVLAESARIVRGKVTSIKEVSAYDIDALILVGGFGAAKNLCSYATRGLAATVNPDVQRLILDINGLEKPIGAMCIAPVAVALALRNREGASKPYLTIGQDANTAEHLLEFGAEHVVTGLDDIAVDETNKIVSTAAFMLASSAAEAEPGITKLVNKVLALAREVAPQYRGAPLGTV